MDITCPRCGAAASVQWYGPCDGCRTELRSRLRGQARDAGDTAFEPGMNVTPNAVALKDD